MENRILLEAVLRPFNISDKKKKELANISLPENTQTDLMFMSAILVSTGVNKNAACFLGSELIKARGSINQKPLDIEHKENDIIGHIVSSIFLDYDGNTIDDEELYKEYTTAIENKNQEEISNIINKLDKLNIDIGIICIIYKDRFPELAEEIERGEWKVSMECYYDDYDLKIGNLIIPRVKYEKFSFLDKNLDKKVKLVVSNQSYGDHDISRVLRSIRFCGVGIVKNPAEVRAVILEAANDGIKVAIKEENEIPTLTIDDITEYKVVNFMDNKDNAAFTDLLLNESDVVDVTNTNGFQYFLLKVNSLANYIPEIVKDSFTQDHMVILKDAVRRSKLDPYSKYIIASTGKCLCNKENPAATGCHYQDYNTYFKTNEVGDIIEVTDTHTNHMSDMDHPQALSADKKEDAYLANRLGPDDYPSGTCAMFEKNIKEFPGRPNSGKVVKSHWCKQFNKSCPVFGADAHDTACLRNKYTRLTVTDNDITEETPYNPTVDPESTTLITPEELPSAKSIDETIPAIPPVTVITRQDKNTLNASQLLEESKRLLDRVENQFVATTIEERKILKDSDFGLPKLRRFPINTVDKISSIMKNFNTIRKTISAGQQIELFKNIIKKSLYLDINTEEFEKNSGGLKFKNGIDYNDSYAIPRLQLLPLNSRQQVISAMSRIAHLKIEISEVEKEQLVTNILRAAKKFNIDTTIFRQKYSRY